jgi:tricorn protease-like protein
MSYDQSHIAFSIRNTESNTGSIAVISSNGKNFNKIVNGISYQVCYSIDDRIYYIHDGNIYSVNDDGSNIIQITPLAENEVFRFNVSPNGESIIYLRFTEPGILLQCDQYGNKHQILFSIDSIAVSGLDYIAEPKFSPDGSIIYFGHKSELISFYDIKTKKMRHIYFGESNIHYIWWIPGTEKLVYTTNENQMFNILSIGINGELKTKLFETNTWDWELRISPIKTTF